MLSIHRLKLNEFEIIDRKMVGGCDLDNSGSQQTQRTDEDYDIEVRVRRTPSGWLYEYYDMTDDCMDAVVFVPYSEMDDVPASPEKRKSFMYRIEMNKTTVINLVMAGFPMNVKEDAPPVPESNMQIEIRRVPGGWIYEYYHLKDKKLYGAAFSPQNTPNSGRIPITRNTSGVNDIAEDDIGNRIPAINDMVAGRRRMSLNRFPRRN